MLSCVLYLAARYTQLLALPCPALPYRRGLVDFNNSLVGHLELFERVKQQLAAGENVVLLANHQTEADPAVRLILGMKNKT